MGRRAHPAPLSRAHTVSWRAKRVNRCPPPYPHIQDHNCTFTPLFTPLFKLYVLLGKLNTEPRTSNDPGEHDVGKDEDVRMTSCGKETLVNYGVVGGVDGVGWWAA